MKSSTPKIDYNELMILDNEITNASNYIDISREELKQLVDEHLCSGDYHTAAFWAEKLLTLSNGRKLNERLPELAHYLSVLTAAQSWQTIITLIERHDLCTKHLVFAYFLVNALFHRELFSDITTLPIGYLCRWDEVPYIQPDSTTYICAESDTIRDSDVRIKLDKVVREKKYEARILFLLAKTYLMVQNRPAAAACLKHCLATNPFYSEAIYLAVDSRLLKVGDLQEIVATSQHHHQSSFGVRVIVHLLDLYDINSDPCSSSMDVTFGPSISELLSDDLAVRSATAFRLYSKGNVREAYKITSGIMHEFGYYSKCFLVHIGCLVHLNCVSELYKLGHQMVKLQPEREITWYTVGCYYYATGQYITAKKFLNKCTLMNSGFGEGWLAYGHALFYVEEHEQAMNCYLRASRILEGHFDPLLYIAVEYCFANNFKLANDFLNDATTVSVGNALILHEQGTVAFLEQDYAKAERLMAAALRILTKEYDPSVPLVHLIASEVSEFWEPLFNNFGHVLRKLGKFAEAIEMHKKSLLLGSGKENAWACLGVCYASQAAIEHNAKVTQKLVDSAIEALNKALALKPGDDLVKLALDKVMHLGIDCADAELTQSLDGSEIGIDQLISDHAKRLKPQRV